MAVAPAKKAADKKPAAADKKPNALQTPLKPSKELAAVIGDGTVTRGAMVSKIWEYIKKQIGSAPIGIHLCEQFRA
jgi:upstream activation factor subunit UAF30